MAVGIFRSFMSAADRFNPDAEEILDGTITAFSLVPEDRRPTFRKELADHIRTAILMPFRDVLSLYPECPMAWMAEGMPTSDTERCVAKARESVLRLLPGRDDHVGLCRTLPLTRMFAHDRLFISSTMTDLADALKQYPKGDRKRVEAFAGQTHSMWIKRKEKEPTPDDWALYYWRTNLAVAPCQYE
jgi:hypothetical protein